MKFHISIRSWLDRFLLATLAAASIASVGGRAVAVEPWADKALAITDGLTVWLDGAKQNDARRQRQQPELHSGDAVDRWYDGSGSQLDLSQGDVDSRPKFRREGRLGLMSFDGEKSNVSADGLKRAFDDLTMFIVAAPQNNPGNFRALLAMNAHDRNDFQTGINLDQGPNTTSRFSVINVEGAGFGGVQNLMTQPVGFRRWQRICLRSTIGRGGTSLVLNGEAAGSRDRDPGKIAMDQLVVGCRFYGGIIGMRGFWTGEIAELLIYDRKLSDEEIRAVDRYLSDKYATAEPIPELPAAPGIKRLRAVENPPPLQVLVPGFAVKQLPVDLPNINNVLYRDDGKLVALGYNGNVYLLADTDGDGLEDTANVFFESKGQLRAPIGMALTPPCYAKGRGIFAPSKSKCSLVVDTNGDDVADEEIVIADGWKESPHNVDALGVEVDRRDGSVYFGLGCQDYTNAYVVGTDGQSGYKIDSERGTIMRIAPDLKSRTIVATGIRFPVGIRFNHRGELFCTDQEGATWLANGNPLDELLQIDLTKKRHYGFPPRHPRYLPGVIDEPSVFDYAPQHESTCGLNFDESVNGGPMFGPAWWLHDVMVTGYSRGKLYRTKLAGTAAGYVAQSQLLAVANMLLADACIAPDGSLIVAAHSGLPDWGSGPSGKGKLYKVVDANQQAPIPVLAWAQTPHEVRVAFDHEVDPETLKDVAAKASIDRGPFVTAGDRFESLRPGYAVVDRQVASPRYDQKILGAQLTADHRMLILSTAQQVSAVNYGLTLPGLGRPANENSANGELPQVPETDLLYDLTGVETVWQPANGEPAWNGWLPHVDLGAAQGLTIGSSFHDDLWQRMHRAGTLTLRTQLRLNDMLRPAIQPGSSIDYQWPPETITLSLTSSGAMFEAKFDGKPLAVREATGKDQQWIAEIEVPSSGAKQTHQLEVRLSNVAQQPPHFSVAYHTNEDSQPRAMQTRRFLLPWASTAEQTDLIVDNRHLPQLKGGNWLHGKKIFFGEQAACSKCHKVRGEGNSIGPDLSNLTQRDYASVVRDITEPSFAINPDFVSHNISLVDGRSLTGTLTNQGNEIVVTDTNARQTMLTRADIESIHPSALSIMPQGLPKQIGPENFRDLLTFLLVEPPKMPIYGDQAPPPARTMDEVGAVLAGSDAAAKTRPIQVVLVTGPKDHGLGEHDYPAWKTVWQNLLGMAADTRVTLADDWPSADELKSADVLVFYQQGKWTAERARDIDAFLKRGGGLVYIHFAVDGGNDAPGFAQRIGLAWRGGQSKFRHGPLDLDFAPGESHPIARNFTKVHFYDESYWNLIGDPRRFNLLATGKEDSESQPLFWTIEQGRGRVFVSIPGHFSWTFDDPLFRVLLLRGIAWAAHEPVDRFNELVTPGARIATPK
ncbi:MAG: ThuA domain-containing protein [Pirellulales bacterium]|nr:ThuA domain-containing protein [Pirellulales bacterium]